MLPGAVRGVDCRGSSVERADRMHQEVGKEEKKVRKKEGRV
jgi:hypothetical protein